MTDTGQRPERVERYALGLIGEECAEAGQMAGKWHRFGGDHARRDGLTARRGLSLELGDVLAAIDFAVGAGIVNPVIVVEQRERKYARLTDPDAVDDEGRRLAPEVARHRLTALAEAGRAGVGDGLYQRKAVNAVLGRLLAPLVPDLVERITIGNEACTAILQALAAAPTPPLPADVPAPDVVPSGMTMAALRRIAKTGGDPGRNRNMMTTADDAQIILAALSQEPRP